MVCARQGNVRGFISPPQSDIGRLACVVLSVDAMLVVRQSCLYRHLLYEAPLRVRYVMVIQKMRNLSTPRYLSPKFVKMLRRISYGTTVRQTLLKWKDVYC